MESEINQKRQISVIDWLVIYISTVVLINVLVKNQIYPSQWISSMLPGGTNDINLLFVHEILQCVLMVGGVLLFLRIRGTTIQQIGWNAPQNAQDCVRAIIYGVLTCSFMLVVSAFLTQIFPQWATTQNVVSTALQVDTPWGITAAFLSVGIMAPLCEELLFRGYLFHAVNKKYGTWPSVIITSFLFAAIHGQWFQLLPLFMAGFFLNAFYLHSRSLIATIFMHSAWNTFSLYLIVALNIYV